MCGVRVAVGLWFIDFVRGCWFLFLVCFVCYAYGCSCVVVGVCASAIWLCLHADYFAGLPGLVVRFWCLCLRLIVCRLCCDFLLVVNSVVLFVSFYFVYIGLRNYLCVLSVCFGCC